MKILTNVSKNFKCPLGKSNKDAICPKCKESRNLKMKWETKDKWKGGEGNCEEWLEKFPFAA